MSAMVLFHHVAKPRLYAYVQRVSIFRAQYLSSKLKSGEKKKEEEEETESTLVYKPTAYYQTPTAQSSTTGRLETEGLSYSLPLNTAFHQCNLYHIGSSQQLSSTKNMLLNSAESTRIATKKPRVSSDPRAFHKCRPEYHNITHDVSQRSSTLDLNTALLVLEEVTVLKSNMGPSDATSFFYKLSQIPHEHIEDVRKDTRFNMLLWYSSKILPEFTLPQLLDVLRSFVNFKLPRTYSMLTSLETEFCWRASEMELHQLLLTADLWRCLKRPVPLYLKKLFDNVIQNFNQLGVPELVQLLYIIGEGRTCPDALIQPVESLLMCYLEQFMPEELAAICLGLFKSQMTLSERAARRLVDRAVAVVKDMSDFGIVTVMKFIRFGYLDHLPWLEAMRSEVPRRASRMEVQGLMHVVLACSAVHYWDERILLAVAEQLPSVASQYRSKDAAKILWAFGTLGVSPSQCPKLYPCLTEILRECQSEFEHFPEHLLTGLLGLAFAGLFPEDLLRVALSAEFVNKACSSKFELKKDLFTLDETVGLELPELTVPRLDHVIKEEIIEKLRGFVQLDVCMKPEVLEAEAVLHKLLGGKMFVRKHMLLPHLRSIDLEVHLDQNNQPVPVSPGACHQNLPSQNLEQTLTEVTITDDLVAQLSNFQKPSNKLIQKPSNKLIQKPAVKQVHVRESILSVGVDLTDNLLMRLTKSGKHSSRSDDSKPSIQRLAVQVTNRNHYCYRTEKLLGLHALKRRQLPLIGYRIVELPHWEWFPLLRRSLAEKLAYMHCKIFSNTDSTETD